MYKVTVEFKTREEMLEFFSADKKVEAVEEAPKKTAKKKTSKKSEPKKEEPKQEEPKQEEVVVEPEIVQEPATQPSPGQAAFNREACLGNVSAVISDLQNKGVDGNAIANMIASIFASLGEAQRKISELDDSTLINFKIAFDKEAPALMPQQAASFI